MLKNASLRLLRDSGSRLSSQVLPTGYSENVLSLIRRFCSAPIERLTNSKVDGEFSYQDAADLPRDNSDCNSEPSHGINATREKFKKHGPKKLHVTEARSSLPWVSQKYRGHEKKLPGKAFQPYLFQIILDTPMNTLTTILDKWVEDGNRLARNEFLLVLFHLRKQKLYNKALKIVAATEFGRREASISSYPYNHRQ